MGIFDVEPWDGLAPHDVEDEWTANLIAHGWEQVAEFGQHANQYCPVCRASGAHTSLVVLRRNLGAWGIESAEETTCSNCGSVAFIVHEDCWSTRVFLKKNPAPEPAREPARPMRPARLAPRLKGLAERIRLWL